MIYTSDADDEAETGAISYQQRNDSRTLVPLTKQPFDGPAEQHIAFDPTDNAVLHIGRTVAGDDDAESEVSNISGASSLASITESIFSIISGSSMSSIAGPQSAVERLVTFFLDDHVIKSLCADALSTVAQGRFERNLRRFLKDFAVGLRKEAGSDQERRAAHFVRLRARNSACMICSALRKKKLHKTDAIEFDYASEEIDSDRSDDEVDDFQQLERFIKESEALQTLRERLQAFVHPADQPFHVGSGEAQEKTSEYFETAGISNVKLDIDSITKEDFVSGAEDRGNQQNRSPTADSRGSATADTNTTTESIAKFRRRADRIEEDDISDEYGYTNPRDLMRYDINRARSTGPLGAPADAKTHRRPEKHSGNSTQRMPTKSSVVTGRTLQIDSERAKAPTVNAEEAGISIPQPNALPGLEEAHAQEVQSPSIESMIDKRKAAQYQPKDQEILSCTVAKPERSTWGFSKNGGHATKTGKRYNKKQTDIAEGKTRIEWKCVSLG